ncbi:PQQ-dependent sugar dehydrogenase [Desulfogranum japonicum]|uniref:PQQ-dependent sugar dehydrogenase n=1 Tax=Desulfogranum japonicum TaxID=231447 RepID=UPI0003FAEAE3|nr:PQQ-dependent sugar dehydrogenase [Desulfogranum japonicum]
MLSRHLLHIFTSVCLVLSGIILYRGESFAQLLTISGKSVNLQVPEGLTVEFIAPLERPRFLTQGPQNELLIGSRTGTIYRSAPPYSNVSVLVTMNGYIHSVAYRDGILYAAETAGVWYAHYNELSTTLTSNDFSLLTALPSATGGHSSRTIIVGPDNNLYIGLGISDNCSNEYLSNTYDFEHRRGGVFRLDESGSSSILVPYSSGLRNPIGLAFHPITEQLYATNAGPDNLGFYQPPEVFAQLTNNSFHGMPWYQYYNEAFRDGQCTTSTPPRPASEATPPAALFAARSTPQGIAFITGFSLGTARNGDAVVAIHGSWAVPDGGDASQRRPPLLATVHFNNNQPFSVNSLVTGFQRNDGSRFARPSGVLFANDNNLYFTSDGGDVTGLFRIRRIVSEAENRRTGSVVPALTLLLSRQP